MVTYLPTYKTRPITVVEMEYATALTLSAPATVSQKVPFTVTGKLTFREGMVDYPLSGRTITLSYNGLSLGTATTDGYGNYSKGVTIPTVGIYTLRADYAGETGLSPSHAQRGLSVGAPTLLTVLVSMVMPIVTGLGVASYL